MPETIIPSLPPDTELEASAVVRKLVRAHRYLAELKGVAKTIPNEEILVSTLSLQEAQSSSEIKNIITMQDALYRYQLRPDDRDAVTRDVAHYADGSGRRF